MTNAKKALDDWIRGDFTEINTDLERHYRPRADYSEIDLAEPDRERAVLGLKQSLLDNGRRLVRAVTSDQALKGTFEDCLELLGNVGIFMAACSRHRLNEPTQRGSSPLESESKLALLLGDSLGVAPRFILAPYSTHNRTQDGTFKSFTRFSDESYFIEYNTKGIFAYERAAAALLKVRLIGISNPITLELLVEAGRALDRVREVDDKLFSGLDVDLFFNAIRPYYLPSYVGNREYRGVNAGDFAGINQIDLMLGLCQADDPFYGSLLAEKQPYVLPLEQQAIRECIHHKSLLDEFVEAIPEQASRDWFKAHGREFLKVCKAHGRTAAVHHNKLVERFIARPARQLPEDQRTRLTASGPPLAQLLDSLVRLRDLRLASPRDDIGSRHEDIEVLKQAVAAGD